MAQRASKDFTMKDVIRKRDNSNFLYGEHQQKNVDRLLTMKMKDSTGKLSNMFAVVEDNGANGSQRYCCLLCSTDSMDVLKFICHAGSKKHKVKLHTVDENHSDDGCKVPSELQARLDEITDQVMIGVEYIIEVCFGDTFEPIFHCVLCEGRLNLQAIALHLTSYVHRLNYLEKHFPTAFKTICAMEKREQKHNFVEKICHNIESQYGRLSMTMVQSDEFSKNQALCYDRILNAEHIDEKMGRTFTESMDMKRNNNGLSPVSDCDETDSTYGLEMISTSSEFEMSPYKASDKVFLRSRKSLRQSHKMNLSPISPERSREFDETFRSRKDLSQLFEHDQSLSGKPSVYESRRHFSEANDTSTTKRKHYEAKSLSPSSSGTCERKESKDIDEKYSFGMVQKSSKRKCTRKKNHRSHSGDTSRSPQGHREKDAGVSQNRDRSRSPQRHKVFMRSYRETPVDYGKFRNYDYYPWQRQITLSGRYEYAFYRPSFERANSVLGYNGRHNHPTYTVTNGEFRDDYRYIPKSIEWGMGDGDYALARPHPERANRPDYSFGYNCPKEILSNSIDYGEYVPFKPHLQSVNRSDYSLRYTGRYKPTTGFRGDNRRISTSIEPDVDDGQQITIISVLSLLSAFENFLGSLGPKMIKLMTEAIAMEKIAVNSSNQILDDIDHCILFETTREKLKGLLSAGIVEANQLSAVKKTIRHMDVVIDEANTRKRFVINSSPSPQSESHNRSAVAEKILMAMNEQRRAGISKLELAQYVDQYMSLANVKEYDDVDRGVNTKVDGNGRSHQEQECNYVDSVIVKSETTEPTTDASASPSVLVNVMSTNTEKNHALTSTDWSVLQAVPSATLSDSNLTTLIRKFSVLSDAEKQEVSTIIRDLELNEPYRMQQLRKQVKIEEFLDYKFKS